MQPGSQEIIKASFNPFAPDQYDVSVPLYIDDPELQSNLPYVNLVLSGEGAFPKLIFDRKEIILPVVPLNITARCVFRIINDGYENLNLDHQVIHTISQINVDIKYPEGKNLGVTRNRIKVEATFSSKKPLSFTTRVEFKDETGRVYPIYISGTTDNCLFTNFAYLQRFQKECRVTQSDKGVAQIVEEDEEDVNSVDGDAGGDHTKSAKAAKKGAPSVVSNKTFSSHASSKSSRSALGYTPIHATFLEANVDYILRWLNFMVLTSTIQQFPQSVIEHNGQQIFELITFLTGKTSFPFKANLEGVTKRQDKVERLYKQYDDLIRMLKQEGALLNHIRPEYLLGYNDYLQYMKSLPAATKQYISQNFLKINSVRHNYISIDAWTSLFYQILKIYYLSRITLKYLKEKSGLPADKLQALPDSLDQSNVYSAHENLILKWLEINYDTIHSLQEKRLFNFDDQLRNSQVAAASIQAYIGRNNDLQFIKGEPTTEADQQSNASKLLSVLASIGLQTYVTAKDLFKPSMREQVLFLLQLMHALPHYIPKSQPIIFSCTLGEEVIKVIELTNPTNKPISYYANLDPHPDFSLETDDTFVIEPNKQSYKVKVKFKSRISDPVSTKLTFTNKKESNISAAALVFELKSNIVGRKSEQTHQVQGKLYEQTELPIQITNQFTTAEYAEFQITIVHEKFKKDAEDKKFKAKGKKKPDAKQMDRDETFPCFFTKDAVKLKKLQTTQLTVTFIPLGTRARPARLFRSRAPRPPLPLCAPAR